MLYTWTVFSLARWSDHIKKLPLYQFGLISWSLSALIQKYAFPKLWKNYLFLIFNMYSIKGDTCWFLKKTNLIKHYNSSHNCYMFIVCDCYYHVYLVMKCDNTWYLLPSNQTKYNFQSFIVQEKTIKKKIHKERDRDTMLLLNM